ncbi:HAD family acid phosphatase [Nocardioides sp. BP30]|uniref:HAD family acid phosphatase n=1 Tax=Nocardioides sp. BP30 TaxID=3036374 RepID=UPI0024695526|nr:HAD family acid phosphatase [Nocardioides sp. BP30]WGL53275.1 HAD family acid phosphatase [Nocardioides sp. BP30]
MRLTRSTVAIAACAVTATALVSGAPAHAAGQLNPATTFTYTVNQDGSVVAPTSGANIPNIDSVKSTIRAYYGAAKGANPAHAFDSTAPATIYLPNLVSSAYAKNTEAVAQSLIDGLPTTGAGKAVVFDVDSTLLSDYANEEEMNYNYSVALNNNWVDNELMPAVPGMVQALETLASEGYALYGITGRPAHQEAATIGNLTKVGFTTDGTPGGTPLFDTDNLYTKPETNADQPGYITGCAIVATATLSKCTTVQYKAQTRAHIAADDGVDIVMNVGDQWSDLEGGYADGHTKIPNPTYFLGSADLPGVSDPTMVPPTSYTMNPDGSTGASVTDGDTIPNEGNVVSLIRAYYKATGGVADKTSSPYITELSSLESTWTPQIVTSCQQQAAKVAAAKAAIAATGTTLGLDTKNAAKAKKAVTRAKKKVKRAHGHAKKVAKKELKAAKKAYASAIAAIAHDKTTGAGITIPKSPAVVFDADDTTLWNYDLEDGAMGFTYSPATAATWIQQQKFPAVPGMVALAKAAKDAGCTIVGLTGRTSDQQADTIANLTKDGYVDASGTPLFTAANYYTKWTSGAQPPAYMDCGDDKVCSTIEYKSGTREYLETQKGLDIVANLGDQFSDLHGGYADATYKIPNPTYYLP